MRRLSAVLFVACAVTASASAGKAITTKGWFADEGCAKGRANGGAYTATNPECALKCVERGARLVFISEDQKAIWVVDKPEKYKGHIGEYVSLRGALDETANTLEVGQVTMIERVRPSCSIRKKPAQH